MEAVFSSETFLLTYKAIRRLNPEDQHRHLHRHDNLKSNIDYMYLSNVIFDILDLGVNRTAENVRMG
jgi:hypothetical protein